MHLLGPIGTRLYRLDVDILVEIVSGSLTPSAPREQLESSVEALREASRCFQTTVEVMSAGSQRARSIDIEAIAVTSTRAVERCSRQSMDAACAHSRPAHVTGSHGHPRSSSPTRRCRCRLLRQRRRVLEQLRHRRSRLAEITTPRRSTASSSWHPSCDMIARNSCVSRAGSRLAVPSSRMANPASWPPNNSLKLTRRAGPSGGACLARRRAVE